MVIQISIDEGKLARNFLLSEEFFEFFKKSLIVLELLVVNVSQAISTNLMESSVIFNVSKIHGFVISTFLNVFVIISLLFSVKVEFSSCVSKDMIFSAFLG